MVTPWTRSGHASSRTGPSVNGVEAAAHISRGRPVDSSGPGTARQGIPIVPRKGFSASTGSARHAFRPPLSRLVAALAAADSLPSTTFGSGDDDATDWQRRRFRIFGLKDTHGYSRFTLIYNRRKVAIDGARMRPSLTRRECNAHILDRFNSDIATLIGDFTRKHSAGLETTEYFMMDLRIQIDGNHYIWSDDVRAGHDFLHLPGEIHRMKWEEKFNCSRNHGSGTTP